MGLAANTKIVLDAESGPPYERRRFQVREMGNGPRRAVWDRARRRFLGFSEFGRLDPSILMEEISDDRDGFLVRRGCGPSGFRRLGLY